jgi:ubiquinone/menaquinone biosynthesis C-methylase UbiE
MRRPTFIARQSAHPRGLLGRLLVAIMERESAAENDRALELLHLGAGDHHLEIGFGHGRTLERAAALIRSGSIAGIDVSPTAVAAASRKLGGLIREGRVELRQGDSSRLPYADATFDTALTVHTLYFWNDPQTHLREIHRVLKPDGRFVLGFRRAEDEAMVSSFPGEVYRFYPVPQVCNLLEQSGFSRVEIEIADAGSKPIAYAVARRPA